eukprot:scaffold97813_cov61-Cyclotella_meneghiniana.AAC.1
MTMQQMQVMFGLCIVKYRASLLSVDCRIESRGRIDLFDHGGGLEAEEKSLIVSPPSPPSSSLSDCLYLFYDLRKRYLQLLRHGASRCLPHPPLRQHLRFKCSVPAIGPMTWQHRQSSSSTGPRRAPPPRGRSVPRSRGRGSAPTPRSASAAPPSNIRRPSRPPHPASVFRPVAGSRQARAPPVVGNRPTSPPADDAAIFEAMRPRGVFDSDNESFLNSYTIPEPPSAGEELQRTWISRGQIALFKHMTRAEKLDDPNFKELEGNVLNGGRSLTLMKERAEENFAGYQALQVPTGGTGAPLTNPPAIYRTPAIANLADLHTFKDMSEENELGELIKNHILRFAGWIYDGEKALLVLPEKGPDGFYPYTPVDPTLPGRRGELNRSKVDYQNSDQTILVCLQNNMLRTAWRALKLACKNQRFKCTQTGRIVESDIIYLFMLTVKSISILNLKVLNLKAAFDALSLKQFGNDPELLIPELCRIQDELKVLAGETACTDKMAIQKTLQVMCPEPKLQGVDLFNTIVAKEKLEWATSGNNYNTTLPELHARLLSVVNMIKTDKNGWHPTTENSQLIALTAQLNASNKTLSEAKTALAKANANAKAPSDAKHPPVSTADLRACASTSASAAKANEYKWRSTRTGDTSINPTNGLLE